MKKLITSAQRSHSAASGDVASSSWCVAGHEPFQALLEQGMEVRAHWVRERFWWKRILYMNVRNGPPALCVESAKRYPPSPSHTICLSNICCLGSAETDSKVLVIEHQVSEGLKGRRLEIEFPTARCADIFKTKLESLIQAMGISTCAETWGRAPACRAALALDD